MTRPEPAGAGTADQLAWLENRATSLVTNPGVAEGYRTVIAQLIVKAACEYAGYLITAAESRAMERCAKIADIFANTKPNLEKSDNPTTARTIAAIISDTGQKIAERIRSSINPPGEEE